MEIATQPVSNMSPIPAGVVILHSSEQDVVRALRALPQLEGLTEEELLWLVQHSSEFSAPVGTRLFSEGDPATHMTILLAGEIQVRRQYGSHGNLSIGRSGQLTGLLPFSRMKSHGGNGFATEPIWGLRIPKELFPKMLEAIPSMGQRCVSVIMDRVREMTRLEQQSEKLNALGKLAANLAHELNNPASAAQRAASNLLEELRNYGRVSFDAGRLCLSEKQEEQYKQWDTKIRAVRAIHSHANPLEIGANEERLTYWLERHGIADVWAIASALAEAGIEPEDLTELEGFLNDEALHVALSHLASSSRAERMTGAVLESTARIFELIQAIQQYSYMDLAPMQDVDVAQSLENTLSMLHYRLNHVTVIREFDADLPRVTANGSELNQAWMALLENALDAMQDHGTLRLCTQHAGDSVRVEIRDDGPGIPPELHSRIFEPFFTTKSPGKGLGLGLDAVQRILSRHRGFIEVQSKPGETCFQVRIPLQQAGAY